MPILEIRIPKGLPTGLIAFDNSARHPPVGDRHFDDLPSITLESESSLPVGSGNYGVILTAEHPSLGSFQPIGIQTDILRSDLGTRTVELVRHGTGSQHKLPIGRGVTVRGTPKRRLSPGEFTLDSSASWDDKSSQADPSGPDSIDWFTSRRLGETSAASTA